MQTCSPEGGWRNTTECSFRCEGGECVGECDEGEKRCDNAKKMVQTCNARNAWENGPVCPAGCENGACVDECNSGDKRCKADGKTPESCTNGTWTSGTICAAQCNQGECITPCTDGDKRCKADGKTPESCTNGAWVSGTACTTSCDKGTCTAPPLPKSGTWKGTTEQGDAFTFDVNTGSTAVTRIETSWDGGCAKGTTLITGTVPLNAGTFSSMSSTCPVTTIAGTLNADGMANGTITLKYTNGPACPCSSHTTLLLWTAQAP